jgi:hypothetical protein
MILSDRCKSMEPFHLEMLILNYNKELWTETTMQKILSAPAKPLPDDDEVRDDEEEEEGEGEDVSEREDEDGERY